MLMPMIRPPIRVIKNMPNAFNILFKRVPLGSLSTAGVHKNIRARAIWTKPLGINLYPQSNVITNRMGQLMLISGSKESSCLAFEFW